MLCMRKTASAVLHPFRRFSSTINYIQGQSEKPGQREYFYYVSHQGMLYLDDARIKNFTSCIKEVNFLKFFFDRLRINESGRYENDFQYLSPCGREKNYVRCDDLPIVFTSFHSDSTNQYLSYNHCEKKLVVPFQPSKLFMGSSGRIYHPGPERLHGVGLVTSKLALDFSQGFQFDINGKLEAFSTGSETFELDYSLKPILKNIGREE